MNIDKVKVCHNNEKSIEVAFPHSMEEHLAHDDTLGPCTE